LDYNSGCMPPGILHLYSTLLTRIFILVRPKTYPCLISHGSFEVPLWICVAQAQEQTHPRRNMVRCAAVGLSRSHSRRNLEGVESGQKGGMFPAEWGEVLVRKGHYVNIRSRIAGTYPQIVVEMGYPCAPSCATVPLAPITCRKKNRLGHTRAPAAGLFSA